MLNEPMTTQSDFDLIKTLANRMIDPEFVKKKVLDPNNKNPKPAFFQHSWHDLSISGGYPGVLPLFVELDHIFPSEGWDLVVHDYIKIIAQSIEKQGIPSLSIFGGLAGVCYYIRQASRNEKRYKKLLDKLDSFLIQGLHSSYLNPLKVLLEKSQPLPPSLYEVIQGLAGIGIYALMNVEKTHFLELLHEIIRLLIQLTRPIEINGRKVPGWYVHRDFFYLEEDKERYPNGNFNLGLSHGIPGVLAFLSIALIHGLELTGQKEAIETISSWLQGKRKKLDNRFFWPTTISFEEEISNELVNAHKSKDAWCYGTPGVSRALYLAGKALIDEELQKFALDSFIPVFNSSWEAWNLPGPSICHGIAGLLIITQRMATDSNSLILHNEVSKLRTILLSHYDSSFIFGFKNPEPMLGGGDAWIDLADLLEGASGIILTLLSLHSKNFRWHLPLLIDY